MFSIVASKTLGPGLTRLDIEAPDVARAALPGQFLMLRADEAAERIPLTIADADPEAGTVTVTIADNGAGFEARSILNGERPHTSGWGLIGIRERTRLLGGECTIDSTPGEGSRISVTIPLRRAGRPQSIEPPQPKGGLSDVEDTAVAS